MKSTRLIYIPVYLNILSKAGASTVPSIGHATLTMDWRGRAREREVKLCTYLDLPCRRDAQLLPWIGVVERANAR